MAAMKLVLYLCFIGLTAGFTISIPDINLPSVDFPGVPVRGSCPSPDVQASFDKNQYSGVWYGFETINPGALEYGWKCTSSNFTLTPSGSLLVTDSGIFVGTTYTRTTESTVTFDASTDAKMTITTGSGWFTQNTPYWVLSTDYTSYSLVYSCRQTSVLGRNLLFLDEAHILTRNRGRLDDSDLATLRNTANEVMTSRAATTRRVVQTGCSASSPSWSLLNW